MARGGRQFFFFFLGFQKWYRLTGSCVCVFLTGSLLRKFLALSDETHVMGIKNLNKNTSNIYNPTQVHTNHMT